MITALNFVYEKFSFPVGETMVRIKELPIDRLANILWEYSSDSEFFELSLIVDALGRQRCGLGKLEIPYFPHSRQDRAANNGEPLSVALAAVIINSLNANEVIITDPHSDVLTALLHRTTVITQDQVFARWFVGKSNFYLIAPDAGAAKKIDKLAERVRPINTVICSKRRNPLDGKIVGIEVPTLIWPSAPCYIVEDICDGGATFVKIAEKLKSGDNPIKPHITLMVSHGFFTKGLPVFDNLIDSIITRKGVIKP